MGKIDDFLISIGFKKPQAPLTSPLSEADTLDDPGKLRYVADNTQKMEIAARESGKLFMGNGEPAVLGEQTQAASTPMPTPTPTATPKPKVVMKNNQPATKSDKVADFIALIRKQKPEVSNVRDETLKDLYKNHGDKIFKMMGLVTPTPYQSKLGGDVRKFIEQRILPIAKKYDLPPQVIAGQFIQEGGLNGIGAERNNFFNLGAYDHDPNKAFSYKTPEEGIEAYAKLMSGKYEMDHIGSGKYDTRYLPAYKVRKDPVKMLSKIKELGYASDPKYVENIMDNEGWRTYSNNY